jgi:hypothetical protein
MTTHDHTTICANLTEAELRAEYLLSDLLDVSTGAVEPWLAQKIINEAVSDDTLTNEGIVDLGWTAGLYPTLRCSHASNDPRRFYFETSRGQRQLDVQLIAEEVNYETYRRSVSLDLARAVLVSILERVKAWLRGLCGTYRPTEASNVTPSVADRIPAALSRGWPASRQPIFRGSCRTSGRVHVRTL